MVCSLRNIFTKLSFWSHNDVIFFASRDRIRLCAYNCYIIAVLSSVVPSTTASLLTVGQVGLLPVFELNNVNVYSTQWSVLDFAFWSLFPRHLVPWRHQSLLMSFDEFYLIQMTSTCGNSFCYLRTAVFESVKEAASVTTRRWQLKSAMLFLNSPQVIISLHSRVFKGRKGSSIIIRSIATWQHACLRRLRRATYKVQYDWRSATTCWLRVWCCRQSPSTTSPASCWYDVRLTTATWFRYHIGRQFGLGRCS